MRTLAVLFVILFSAMFFIGCAHEKYGKFSIQVINTVSGVSGGMSKKGDLFVISRDDERQAIYVSGSRSGPEKIFNCSNAPLIYIAVPFFGKKHTSILRVELPAKNKSLKYYRYREVGNNLMIGGKKVWIINLREVSPDGRELRVDYEVQDQYGRKRGTYYPATNTITAQ